MERVQPPPGYKTQSEDTDYTTELRLFELLRALSPRQKADMLTRLARSTHRLRMAGLRLRWPHASEQELRLRAAAISLGREQMIRWFGWDPETAAPPARACATMTKVDIHIRPASGFSRLQIERAQRLHLGPDPWDCARVASAEDMVAQELSWFRRGGEVSDRQWRDVLGMLKQGGPRLDFAYLRHWCRELGVSDLLARAMTESGLGSLVQPDP